MKFYAYAALIATTQAGPFADKVKSNMAKAKDVAKVEDTVTEWFERAEEIHYEAAPAMERRNSQWKKEWVEAGQREENIAHQTYNSLEKNDMRAMEQWTKSQQKFETAVEKNGAVKDFIALEAKVDKDLTAVGKYMEERKKHTKALAARRAPSVVALAKMTDSAAEHAPTEAEIDAAEEVVAGWLERGHDIMVHAEPAV
jgi:hypothetical protein